jgi:hypothetical protein
MQQFQGQTAVEVAAVDYNSHNQYLGESVEIVAATDPTQFDSHQMLEDSYHKVAEVSQDKLQAAYNRNQAAVGVAHQVGPSLPEDEEGDSPAEHSHLTLGFWYDSAKI